LDIGFISYYFIIQKIIYVKSVYLCVFNMFIILYFAGFYSTPKRLSLPSLIRVTAIAAKDQCHCICYAWWHCYSPHVECVWTRRTSRPTIQHGGAGKQHRSQLYLSTAIAALSQGLTHHWDRQCASACLHMLSNWLL
jgi:hypothetical protein